MKQLRLTLLCLLAALLLTACYTDNDPWPSEADFTSPTAVPAVTMAPESTTVEMPRTYLTPDVQPAGTPIPTEIPAGEDETGING